MERRKPTLSDIGGYKEEKEEAKHLIEFLSHYQEYIDQGAYLPKGILLAGEPGVGKTLFATAIASEAKVPLFTLAGESEDMVGERLFESINAAFEKAKKNTPCVLMLDEIGNFLPRAWGMEPSDRGRDILNLLLTRIDGIENSEGILIIATCNDDRELDAALTRPGRIEKVIRLEAPNQEEREDICRLYLKKSPLLHRVDAKELSLRIGKSTGAEIKRIINDALVYSIAKKKVLKATDFTPFIFASLMRGVKKDHKQDDLPVLATHEIGHFLCGYVLNKEVGDILVEKYSSNGGIYRPRKEKEGTSMSEDALFHDTVIALGGLAATEVMYGKRYTGASVDMSHAVQNVITASNNGLLGFDALTNEVLSRYRAPFGPSPLFHSALKQYLDGAYATAKSIIAKNKSFLEEVREVLVEKKAILSNEMEALLKEHPIDSDLKVKLPSKHYKPLGQEEGWRLDNDVIYPDEVMMGEE